MTMENPSRQVAITRGSAPDNRISGAAQEMPASDRASTSIGEALRPVAGGRGAEVISDGAVAVDTRPR